MKMTKPTGFFDTIGKSIHFSMGHFLKYLWLSIIAAAPIILIVFLIGIFTYFIGDTFAQSNLVDPSASYGSAEFDQLFSWSISAIAIAIPIMIGLFILYFLYIFFFSLCFLRLTTSAYHDQYKSAREIIRWSWSRFGSFLMLLLRVFLYSLAWLPIVVMIAIALIAGIAEIEPSEPVINLILFVIQIPVIIRGIRVVFAQYAFAEKKLTSKEALEYSIKLSKGNWWKIFGYILGTSILFVIGMMLIILLGSLLTTALVSINEFLLILAGIIAGIMYLYIIYFFIAYYMMLYKRFDKN